jgi:hypothetical protein
MRKMSRFGWKRRVHKLRNESTEKEVTERERDSRRLNETEKDKNDFVFCDLH